MIRFIGYESNISVFFECDCCGHRINNSDKGRAVWFTDKIVNGDDCVSVEQGISFHYHGKSKCLEEAQQREMEQGRRAYSETLTAHVVRLAGSFSKGYLAGAK
jgi:hypothetical protein